MSFFGSSKNKYKSRFFPAFGTSTRVRAESFPSIQLD